MDARSLLQDMCAELPTALGILSCGSSMVTYELLQAYSTSQKTGLGLQVWLMTDVSNFRAFILYLLIHQLLSKDVRCQSAMPATQPLWWPPLGRTYHYVGGWVMWVYICVCARQYLAPWEPLNYPHPSQWTLLGLISTKNKGKLLPSRNCLHHLYFISRLGTGSFNYAALQTWAWDVWTYLIRSPWNI